MNHQKWLDYFKRNRLARPEPDWRSPMKLPAEMVNPLLNSLEQFRLGEGSGPKSPVARKAKKSGRHNAEMNAIVDAWFREEAEHARLLGCAVTRLGGRHTAAHWSCSAFCLCRKIFGAQFKLQVLLIAELVGTAYYRLLEAHCPDEAICDVCRLILLDEAGHVAFHRERLADAGRSSIGLNGALWQSQFWLLGHAAAALLWLNHARCLKAIGGSRREYFMEATRQLRQFIISLDRLGDSLNERIYAEGIKPAVHPYENSQTTGGGRGLCGRDGVGGIGGRALSAHDGGPD